MTSVDCHKSKKCRKIMLALPENNEARRAYHCKWWNV